MRPIAEVKPEHRAILSMIFHLHRSYGEVGALLGADEQEVREHAQTALTVLASRESPVVAEEVREHLGDYLLGECSCPVEYLEPDTGTADRAQALVWGRAVNEGLAELLGLAPYELHSLTCEDAPNPSAVPIDDGPPMATLRPPATPAGVRGRLGSLRVTALAVAAAGIVIGICAAWVIGPPRDASHERATRATRSDQSVRTLYLSHPRGDGTEKRHLQRVDPPHVNR